MFEPIKENATFICGHRKSGTTLLLALLDAHPSLLVYPADSGFFYGVYPRHMSDEYSDEDRVERASQFVVDQLKSALGKLSAPDRQDLGFPLERFREEFSQAAAEESASPRNLLLALFDTYSRFMPTGSPAMRWVEKTTSTEIYAAEVMEWFPNAKFIHVVRDPRDNWASLRSGWKHRYQDMNDSVERLLQSMIDRALLGLRFAIANSSRFGSDVYKVVRYEDLVLEPETNLADICAFLQIPDHPLLRRPTVCGKLWRGNNFDGLEFEGISDTNVGRWRERSTPEEAALLEFYFREVMSHFGYECQCAASTSFDAATEHYKWFNFAQRYSQGIPPESCGN